jgi:thiol peroxidase
MENTMTEKKTGIITFKGKGVTLLGPDIKVGATAPDFKVVNNSLQPVTLANGAGKIQLIAVVPSLDTGVCDTMTRRFNQDAAALPAEVVTYTISLDLPFAQSRWCGNAGIERVQTLSDYQERSFGLAYGLLIDELKLLARAVYVIDKQGKIAYREIVSEVTAEPDYAAAIAAVKALL